MIDSQLFNQVFNLSLYGQPVATHGEPLRSRGPEQAGLGGITPKSNSPYSNEEWWHFLMDFFGSEDAISERLRVDREAFEDALAFVAAVVPSVRGGANLFNQTIVFWFGFSYQTNDGITALRFDPSAETSDYLSKSVFRR